MIYLKKLSHSVYNDISEVPENDKFDLIICIHVLDHIPNISEYIIKISNMLNKKGYIIGVVHDESSGLAKNTWQKMASILLAAYIAPF